MPPVDPGLAWRVEETELNAWPALRTIHHEGWLLRFAAGVSRRANSANPLHLDSRGDAALIAAVEGHYRRLRQPAIFRIVSLLDPAFDRLLAARGYSAEGETRTLYGPVATLPTPSDPPVTLSPLPNPRWCTAMALLQGHSPAQARTYRTIVSRIALPAAFAMHEIDGVPAAMAFAIVHRGLLCFESVVTAAPQRRRGHARRVLARLAAWGRAQGATGACLQVQADNAPAVPLYESIGLTTELYRYHYRREPARRA